MNKKTIPYGRSNYEELVQKNSYFVDKTAYIGLLESYDNPVFLRPRRFGKSLWCSILSNYYDINKRERFEKLFGSTDIGKDPTPHKNTFMVLHVDFSVIEVNDALDTIEHSFNNHCNNCLELLVRQNSARFLNQDDLVDHQQSIAFNLDVVLTAIVEKELPPLYVIIDEYDNFSNQLVTTHKDSLYYHLTADDSFFKTFFKLLKRGRQSGGIANVFITGVLPITMDDMSSGFNIASFLTLRPTFSAMLGYTQAEVDHLLDAVFKDYGLDSEMRSEVDALIENHYNGYQFVAGSTDKLYNSAILMYFLRLLCEEGKIPKDLIDPNLKTSIQWVKRIAQNDAQELVDNLSIDQISSYDDSLLREKFNMGQFFDKAYQPISFFYLGMLTIKDEYGMCVPNTNMRTIMLEYFNELHHIDVSTQYADMMRGFVENPDLEKLFANYWKLYISQFLADIFQKVNENFYRSTFYELCRRHLSHVFSFYVEHSLPSGRSDLEFVGKYQSQYAGLHYVLEFKYYSNAEVEKQKLDIETFTLLEDDKKQVTRYAADIALERPEAQVSAFVIYCFGNQGYRLFRV